VGGLIGILFFVQFSISTVISLPIIYWILMSFSGSRNDPGMEFESEVLEEIMGKKICVILPMRNESMNVNRKIDSIISEILPYQSTELLVVDSDSNDGTGDLARDSLEASKLEQTRWEVIKLDVPGKNYALNRVLKNVTADIIAISDADANVSPGWMEVVLKRMSNQEVGVVSGIEKVQSLDGGFNGFYRRKSNQLRIWESNRDSTPVLEGSILAWKTDVLKDFALNQRYNADDAQIGLESIRRGYRSIVDERITFNDFDEKKRTFSESIRRSQGLSMALLNNGGLSIFGRRRASRLAIFNGLILYIAFPWLSWAFAINSVIAFSITREIGYSWPFLSVCLIAILLLSPQGRYVAKGASIAIISHIQAIMRKRYGNWDPVRSFKQP